MQRTLEDINANDIALEVAHRALFRLHSLMNLYIGAHQIFPKAENTEVYRLTYKLCKFAKGEGIIEFPVLHYVDFYSALHSSENVNWDNNLSYVLRVAKARERLLTAHTVIVAELTLLSDIGHDVILRKLQAGEVKGQQIAGQWNVSATEATRWLESLGRPG